MKTINSENFSYHILESLFGMTRGENYQPLGSESFKNIRTLKIRNLEGLEAKISWWFE